MALIIGIFLILTGLTNALDTVVWRYFADDPAWGNFFVQTKTAAFPLSLIFDILTLLAGVITLVIVFVIKRHFRCSDCGTFVQKRQNYCGNCRKKL